MSQEPHPARTDEETAGSVPAQGPEEQAAMAARGDEDRGGVPPEGTVPDDLAEAGEEQLKEGMSPGGRVSGAGDRNPEDELHGSAGASGTPGAGDRS